MLPSATVALNERSNELRRQGKRIYKLGLGQSPFPVPSIVVDALRQHAHEKDYLPVKGLTPLRDAVAAYHHRRDDADRSGNDVLIGPGSKELMFLLQLVYCGELIIPSPSWVSYDPQAKIIGRTVTYLPTEQVDDWRLSADTLHSHCQRDPGKPRLLILNYPQNPTGHSYSAAHLQGIAETARAHGILLLSDEIYGELHHKGEHRSIAEFYPEGTIISAGLSKWCGAGGWRLGTMLFPPELAWLRDAMAVAASETFTSTSAPIQYASVKAYEDLTELKTYRERSRRLLQALGQYVGAELASAGLSCPPVEGGFYLFADWSIHTSSLTKRGIHSSKALTEHLLEDTGVAILPGSDFGRPPSELTTRLAYVDFDGGTALDALGDAAPDATFLRQHCPSVVSAIEGIHSWL